MTDEAAILLRVAIFGLVAGVIYWIVSDYEALGTVTLLLLGVGPGFAGLILVQEHRQQGGPAESRADAMRRLAGIPPRDPPGPRDLEDDDLGVLPLPTIWPLAASLGVAILLTGLIYGLWLTVLGIGVTAYAAWGWLASVNRENRLGPLRAEAPPPDPPADDAGDAGDAEDEDAGRR